jgi:hypothetical protein
MSLTFKFHVFVICALFYDNAPLASSGIVVFLGLFLTFLHANSVLKNQVKYPFVPLFSRYLLSSEKIHYDKRPYIHGLNALLNTFWACVQY